MPYKLLTETEKYEILHKLKRQFLLDYFKNVYSFIQNGWNAVFSTYFEIYEPRIWLTSTLNQMYKGEGPKMKLKRLTPVNRI